MPTPHDVRVRRVEEQARLTRLSQPGRQVSLAALVIATLILAPISTAGQALPERTATGWSATVLPRSKGFPAAALVVGVAVGPSSLVAVGERLCERARRDTFRCSGQAWTSPDGTAWEAVDARTSGLDLGYLRPVIGGPEIGLAGVAFGPGGFVAFGRAQAKIDGRQVSAVWRSDDGGSWERVPTDSAFPTGARLWTILGADDGYMLGGVIYGERAPRAAIWSSPDGRTWTLARGRGTFEIGGYIDTLEDPASGGVNAFATYPGPTDGRGSIATGAVAVGQGCMPSFDEDPWAWNGACWGELWRSPDGLTWRKRDMPRTRGGATTVATIGPRIVADAPICWEGCPSAILVSDDGSAWRIAHGSPVDGELVAVTAAAGRFHALLKVPDQDSGWQSLALWSSVDGTDWSLEEAQPTLPGGGMTFHDVDLAVAGDHRLVVTAAGESAPDGAFTSIALLGPPT